MSTEQEIFEHFFPYSKFKKKSKSIQMFYKLWFYCSLNDKYTVYDDTDCFSEYLVFFTNFIVNTMRQHRVRDVGVCKFFKVDNNAFPVDIKNKYRTIQDVVNLFHCFVEPLGYKYYNECFQIKIM